MSNDDGATPDKETPAGECMGRFKHHWAWVWEDRVWTDLQRCTTCGETRLMTIPERKPLPPV